MRVAPRHKRCRGGRAIADCVREAGLSRPTKGVGMATAGTASNDPVWRLGDLSYRAVVLLGDFTLFSLQTVGWLFRRWPAPRTILPNFYLVGVRSVPVVAITGTFIGMVMAVQIYA